MSEGLKFAYQQAHHGINENRQWHRKAALYSLNTIAINVMYIDRVELMHFHYITYGHAAAQETLPRGSYNLQFW